MSLTRIPQAVRWFDGMRLAPPHFEQQNLRMERLSAYLHLRSSPFDWGVLDLVLAYTHDGVSLEQIEAIMPDGQCVSLEKGVDDPVRINLKDLGAADGDEIELFLYLAGEDVASISVTRAGTGQAFPFQVYRPRLQLVHAAPANAAPDSLLPLVRVSKGVGEYGAAPGYTAPWIRLPHDAPLHVQLKQLGSTLRACYDDLADKCRLAEEQGKLADMAHKQSILSGLGTHILELAGHQYGMLVHPFQAYLQLCRLLGMLSGVDYEHACPSVPEFAYRDLEGCMTPLIAAIGTRCRGLAPAYATRRFRGNPAEGFEIGLAEVPDAEQYYIGLRRPSQASEQDMAAWLHDAVIGELAQMPALRRQRTGGIGSTLLQGEAARAILAQPGLTLFRLDSTGAAFKGFQRDAVLRIEGPRDGGGSGRLAPREILLVGKVPAASAAGKEP